MIMVIAAPFWDIVGHAMVTNQYVRLTADGQSQRGGIWNIKVFLFVYLGLMMVCVKMKMVCLATFSIVVYICFGRLICNLMLC